MFVRLPLEEEFPEVLALAIASTETQPGERVEAEVLRDTYRRYIEGANPTFFVVEHKGRLVAMLTTYTMDYDHRSGLYATQRLFFVLPEYRGSRAAALLMRHFIEWARDTMKADAIFGGNDNGFHSEQTAKFLRRFGFRQVGYAMRLDLW